MGLPRLWLCATAVFCIGGRDVAGQITDIKAQKKNKNRVSVYLGGEYGFSLGFLVAAPLGRGDTLSDQEIEELLTRDAEETAYDRTLKYLAYRPRSSAEVVRYLSQKGVAPKVRDLVLDRLRGAGLVDDNAFAQFWVENRESFRPQGRRLLRQELRQKGISEGLIDEVLSGVEEDRSAYAAAVQRAVRYAHLEDEAFREKMYGYLRRRGFDYEVVAETTARLLTERCEGGTRGS
jgi:regulatory protein